MKLTNVLFGETLNLYISTEQGSKHLHPFLGIESNIKYKFWLVSESFEQTGMFRSSNVFRPSGMHVT